MDESPADQGGEQRVSVTLPVVTCLATQGGMHFTRSAGTAGRSSGTGAATGVVTEGAGAGVITGGRAAGARAAGDSGGGPSFPPSIPQPERTSADRLAAPAISSFMTRPSTWRPVPAPLPRMDREAIAIRLRRRQVAATGQPFSWQSFLVAVRPAFTTFSSAAMSTSASLLM